MNLNTALGFLKDAAEVRQTQWRKSSEGDYNVIDELFEAPTEEQENMAQLLDKALTVANEAGPLYGSDDADTAMCMMEWFAHAGKLDRMFLLEPGGVGEMRAAFLTHASQLNDAWQIASDSHGWDGPFDLEFVPAFMDAATVLYLQPCEYSVNMAALVDAVMEGIGGR